MDRSATSTDGTLTGAGPDPRPLTDEEKAVLREAVGPLLPDVDATRQTLPDIREEAHHDRGEDAVCAWIPEPGGRDGQGIEVRLYCSPAPALLPG